MRGKTAIADWHKEYYVATAICHRYERMTCSACECQGLCLCKEQLTLSLLRCSSSFLLKPLCSYNVEPQALRYLSHPSATASNMADQQAASPLLGLPPELRNQIWHYLVPHHSTLDICSMDKGNPLPSALRSSCRQIRTETSPIFYGSNTFTMMVANGYWWLCKLDALLNWLQRIDPQASANVRKVEVTFCPKASNNIVQCSHALKNACRADDQRIFRAIRQHFRTFTFDPQALSVRSGSLFQPTSVPDPRGMASAHKQIGYGQLRRTGKIARRRYVYSGPLLQRDSLLTLWDIICDYPRLLLVAPAHSPYLLMAVAAVLEGYTVQKFNGAFGIFSLFALFIAYEVLKDLGPASLR